MNNKVFQQKKHFRKVEHKNRHVWRITKKISMKSEFKQKVTKIWRDFCTVTAMVGLKFIGSHKRSTGLVRILWIILWLSQFCFMIWLSSALFQKYLSYDVATAMRYDTMQELPFPAITICNMNQFRKSVIGSNMPMMISTAAFYAKTEADIPRLINENNKTCFVSNRSTTTTKWLDMPFMSIMEAVTRDSHTDVAKCWWRGVEQNCSGLFANHITDLGWCYSFNQDEAEAENNNVAGEQKINFGGYGLDKDNKFEKVIKIAGLNNGFRVVLDIGQQDYCGAGRKYNGAGLIVQIHDRRTQSNFLTTSAIGLFPGFGYKIQMRPVLFQRFTEHLGLCLNQMHLSMFPQYESEYFQMACWAQCVTGKLLEFCKCASTNYEGKEKALGKMFNIPEIHVCRDISEIFCMRNLIDDYFTREMKNSCPQCKVACVENFYEYQISSSKYPKNRFLELLGESALLGNRTYNDTEKNFLMADFFFDTMVLLNVAESQAFTFRDLMVSFGWMMGMFLGTSFVTPVEVAYYLSLTIEAFIKFLCKKGTLRKVNSSVVESIYL